MAPVPGAITFDHFGTWARTNGLEVVILVTGALLLGRLARWISLRVTDSIDHRSTAGDALVRSEAAKHRHSVTAVATWAFRVLLYIVTAVLVVQRLEVPLPSLVAPATVIGVALGFGAQRIVQDLLAGFFVVAERQYGFGDLIRISPLGDSGGVLGTVEEVTLRVTRLRTVNGEVVFIPNGQIVQVTNLSREWARSVIEVPVPVTADIGVVNGLLHQVGEAAFEDEELRPLLLDAPVAMGIDSISVDQFVVRMVARTLPGKQFEVGRALRVRIALALRQAGVAVPSILEADAPGGEDP